MKITVDWDLCESNGMCAAVAPEVFELDDDGNLDVTPPTSTEAQERVRSAVDRCPKNALSIR